MYFLIIIYFLSDLNRTTLSVECESCMHVLMNTEIWAPLAFFICPMSFSLTFPAWMVGLLYGSTSILIYWNRRGVLATKECSYVLQTPSRLPPPPPPEKAPCAKSSNVLVPLLSLPRNLLPLFISKELYAYFSLSLYVFALARFTFS